MGKNGKVVVTVLGADKIGIVAGITGVLAQHKANIIDLTSSKMKDLFVMLILIDIT
jgi:ACT domain-containing protein